MIDEQTREQGYLVLKDGDSQDTTGYVRHCFENRIPAILVSDGSVQMSLESCGVTKIGGAALETLLEICRDADQGDLGVLVSRTGFCVHKVKDPERLARSLVWTAMLLVSEAKKQAQG